MDPRVFDLRGLLARTFGSAGLEPALGSRMSPGQRAMIRTGIPTRLRGRHLRLPKRPRRTYAIGDVHGRLDLLRRLEAVIAEDAGGEDCLIVMLGDYVDRGPNSAGVIDHLVAPTPMGWSRICLIGNHEAMMINAFGTGEMTDLWLGNGGARTLASYGISLDLPQRHWRLPPDHLTFLRRLELSLSMPGFCFVHAGRARGQPVAQQPEYELLWMRRAALHFVPRPEDHDTIVHGHTPTDDPLLSPGRIAIDTGAFLTGTLTALAIDADGEIRFLRT